MKVAIDVTMHLAAEYQKELKERPLRTKALTSASMGICGEILAHVLKKKPIYTVSLRRVLAFGVFGGAITGPLMHFWYGVLEQVRTRDDKSLTPMQKLFLDRLVLTPPFVALTIFALGVLNGACVQAARSNVRATYFSTLFMNWRVRLSYVSSKSTYI
ncbi:hypothetical protein AeMF1_011343 [Aphanomyces euteiches]|nr:hypothetical protein AeMF1_011343 [Aphanomyces euteiches]KAH9190179.1 hypothetical protein AeNC1_007845 [Aphanomyces euteiches]